MTKRVNLRTGVSTFANRYKPNPQTKVCKRASTFPAQEKLFFKTSFPTKNFKTATAQPTHKDQNINLTITAKPSSEKTYTTRTTERQLVTAVWRNGGFSGKLKFSNSNQVLWWVDSFVLLNPPLRQAANRYGTWPLKDFPTNERQL